VASSSAATPGGGSTGVERAVGRAARDQDGALVPLMRQAPPDQAPPDQAPPEDSAGFGYFATEAHYAVIAAEIRRRLAQRRGVVVLSGPPAPDGSLLEKYLDGSKSPDNRDTFRHRATLVRCSDGWTFGDLVIACGRELGLGPDAGSLSIQAQVLREMRRGRTYALIIDNGDALKDRGLAELCRFARLDGPPNLLPVILLTGPGFDRRFEFGLGEFKSDIILSLPIQHLLPGEVAAFIGYQIDPADGPNGKGLPAEIVTAITDVAQGDPRIVNRMIRQDLARLKRSQELFFSFAAAPPETEAAPLKTEAAPLESEAAPAESEAAPAKPAAPAAVEPATPASPRAVGPARVEPLFDLRQVLRQASPLPPEPPRDLVPAASSGRARWGAPTPGTSEPRQFGARRLLPSMAVVVGLVAVGAFAANRLGVLSYGNDEPPRPSVVVAAGSSPPQSPPPAVQPVAAVVAAPPPPPTSPAPVAEPSPPAPKLAMDMPRPESPPPAAVVQPPSDAPIDQVRPWQRRHGAAAPPANADRPAVAGGQPPQAVPEEAPPPSQASAPVPASRSTTVPQSTTVPKKMFEVIYYPPHSAEASNAGARDARGEVSGSPPSREALAAPTGARLSPPIEGDQVAVLVPPSTSPAPVGEPEKVTLPGGTSLEMVALPGGTFVMGSAEDESEKPVHGVVVAPFAIARYPVTVRQWKECVAAKGCPEIEAGDDNAPMTNVSWDDAEHFVAWLSEVTKREYRLPSEAEWEYAARAGTQTRYWWGDAFRRGLADCRGCGASFDPRHALTVGGFPANAFGLSDMAGTVAEWVADCWHKNYRGAPARASTWDGGDCQQHVLRGGSWQNDPSYLRASSRDSYDTYVRYPTHGFRPAWSLQQGSSAGPHKGAL
jgi:formylglycine-generating enzyme required for sulfatase activity